MTSISLHRPPAWGVVAVEQLRAVATALRKEAIGFVIVSVLFFALGIRAAFADVGSAVPAFRIAFGSSTGLPVVVLALLIPLGVWRGEDPARRAYHWAMPVPRMRHTLTKVAAGLVWAMVAVAAYLLLILALSLSVGAITGRPIPTTANLWEWAVPFTASGISYLFASAIIVGLRHPWRWILGCVPTIFVLLVFARPLGLGWLADGARALANGYYGMGAATGANLLGADGRASVERWIVATLLWGSVVSIAMLVAAHRHIEEA
ncbi:MAG: hypothetical protein HOP28_10530 [Gemmatimonadales bacterium]|nr:hypothetical protein [Gemmatimonadales bacterium]